MTEEKKVKAFCAACKKQTNHIVLSEIIKDIDYDFEPDERRMYQIIECAGCDWISYRTSTINYGDLVQVSPDDWEPNETINQYPPILRNHKTTIYQHYLPQKIKIIYQEAIKAFSMNCYLLTGVAFRAVIEAICKDKKVPGRDLNAMINNLAKNKLITDVEAERLHPIRFIGNDSIHEMTVPSTKALYIVLDVVEHLLNNLYIIDNRIKYTLETVINNFEDFKLLLSEKMSKLAIGEEHSLTNMLGRSYRRLHNKVSVFESELQNQIKAGTFNKLEIGSIEPNDDPKKIIQKYVIKDNSVEDELTF